MNLAAWCGSKGKKTLLIDLDPQTNATFSSISVEDWDNHSKQHGTIGNLLGAREHTTAEKKKPELKDVLLKNVFPSVDLIPSHLELFTIDLDLAGVTARELRLKKAIADSKDEYDIIICDCPPNLTIPTQNAIALSTHYLVPISVDYLSILGVGMLIKRIEELCSDLEKTISHAGIVFSRIGRPAYHRSELKETVRAKFGDLVLDAELKERSSVAESAAKQTPVYQFGDADAIREWNALSEEVIVQRLGVQI